MLLFYVELGETMDCTKLYNNITALLSEKGITAEHMLASMNMSKNAVSKLNSTSANPTLNTIERIAAYLGTTTKFLLYGELGDALSTNERFLLKYYSQLGEDDQVEVLQDIAVLARQKGQPRVRAVQGQGKALAPNDQSRHPQIDPSKEPKRPKSQRKKAQ